MFADRARVLRVLDEAIPVVMGRTISAAEKMDRPGAVCDRAS